LTEPPAVTTLSLPGGETIWYRRSGSGVPVLHIHGSAFGHRNFERLTPCVAADFEVIDFDLPGYGKSAGRPRDGGLEGIADQVREFIEALDVAPVHVHGTSFGAMVALILAAKYPQSVDRLVLSCFLARYDGAARMMRATWRRAARDSGMAAVSDLTAVAGFGRAFYEREEAEAQLASMRDAFSRTDPEAFVRGTKMLEDIDLSPWARRISAPSLLIAGEEDNMTPFSPAGSGVGFATVQHMIPGCELVVLPDCGHYLVLEQPEATAALVREFLRAGPRFTSDGRP
jgi:3-oxoadipate enol-lactonase